MFPNRLSPTIEDREEYPTAPAAGVPGPSRSHCPPSPTLYDPELASSVYFSHPAASKPIPPSSGASSSGTGDPKPFPNPHFSNYVPLCHPGLAASVTRLCPAVSGSGASSPRASGTRGQEEVFASARSPGESGLQGSWTGLPPAPTSITVPSGDPTGQPDSPTPGKGILDTGAGGRSPANIPSPGRPARPESAAAQNRRDAIAGHGRVLKHTRRGSRRAKTVPAGSASSRPESIDRKSEPKSLAKVAYACKLQDCFLWGLLSRCANCKKKRLGSSTCHSGSPAVPAAMSAGSIGMLRSGPIVGTAPNHRPKGVALSKESKYLSGPRSPDEECSVRSRMGGITPFGKGIRRPN